MQTTDQTIQGYVEFYGLHTLAGGWFLYGWTSFSLGADDPAPVVTARFDQGEVTGQGLVCFFDRADLPAGGRGMVIFVPSASRAPGILISLIVAAGDKSAIISPAGEAPRLREVDLAARIRPMLAGASQSPARSGLLALLARGGYSGTDTLGDLSDPVQMQIDLVIRCPPDGMVLVGWLLAQPGRILSIRLRCGDISTPVSFESAIGISRPDVIETVGQEYGFTDDRCGFMVYVEDVLATGETAYLEIETASREVGFRNLPDAKLHGLPAIRHILEQFEVQFNDVAPAFETVVGPAISRLNDEHLRIPPRPLTVAFGPAPKHPRYSVVVTLHGRIDFIEYQLAFFSCHPAWCWVDLIYVLDDPARRNELERLAESVYQRFRVPFRVIVLDRNLGFAPANNVGLNFARGGLVCFLNSDVFPGTPDWLEQLGARMHADPSIGAIGPMLLFEDETVQHEGISFSPIHQFAGWLFPIHDRKGRRPVPDGGLKFCDSITGACLMVRRKLALEMGGFDEGFVIGDFEDTDLCLRLREAGLRCAVDLDVRLYHLERQSQASSSQLWRMNLTLYNAWRHEQRWRDRIIGWRTTAPAMT